MTRRERRIAAVAHELYARAECALDMDPEISGHVVTAIERADAESAAEIVEAFDAWIAGVARWVAAKHPAAMFGFATRCAVLREAIARLS